MDRKFPVVMVEVEPGTDARDVCAALTIALIDVAQAAGLQLPAVLHAVTACIQSAMGDEGAARPVVEAPAAEHGDVRFPSGGGVA